MADSRGNNLSFYRAFISQIQLRSFPLSTHEFIIITARSDCWHSSNVGVHRFTTINISRTITVILILAIWDRFSIRYRRNFNPDFSNYHLNSTFLNFSCSINCYFFIFSNKYRENKRCSLTFFLIAVIILLSLFIAKKPLFRYIFYYKDPFSRSPKEGSNNDFLDSHIFFIEPIILISKSLYLY